MTPRLTVVGYHNVEPTPSSPFEHGNGATGLWRQLVVLRRVANVVPLGPSLEKLYAGGELPRRAVAITFDDGYRDALRVALPLLERLELPATFFLAPAIISRDCSAWWERLSWAFQRATSQELAWRGQSADLRSARSRNALLNALLRDLKRLPQATRDAAIDDVTARLAPNGSPSYDDLFLDWDECRSLARRGFEVGSHSLTHTILAREDAAFQLQDLAFSKKLLEDELTTAIDLLAYPNGERADFSEETIAAAREVGYSFAVTTMHGRNTPRTNPYQVRRVIMQPELGIAGLSKAFAQLSVARWRPHGSETIP
jgi:peptidoglycan/xylan/chitin deacetylase (PgdA/CDA1 family)